MQDQADTLERAKEESSPFSIEEVQLQYPLKSRVCKLFVRNNYVYIILKSGTIQGIDLDKPEDVNIINLPIGSDQQIKDAWVDDFNYHLILRSSKNEYFYIRHNSSTYSTLSRLKNLNVSCICFFSRCTTKTFSGPLLVTTSNRLLLEYSIDNNKEKFLKTIVKLKFPIIQMVSSLHDESKGVLSYNVDLFAETEILCYKTKIPAEPASNVQVFQALGKDTPSKVDIEVISRVTSHGNYMTFYNSETIFVDKVDLTECDEFSPRRIPIEENVRCVTLTGYFILVITTMNKLVVYNQLNFNIIEKFSLSYLGLNILGISFDSINRTFWLYSDHHIFELIINIESTGIIDALIQKHMYDEALKIVSPSNKVHRGLILRKKGYFLLNEQQYKKAIDVFLQTDEAFDRVALAIFEVEDQSLLRYYLNSKLSSLPSSMKAQKILLATWIVETYAEQLNSIKNTSINSTKHNKSIINGLQNDDSDNLKSSSIDQEFQNFLKKNMKIFDKETVYQILISHNCGDDLLFFAELMQDYDFVLKHYISLQRWDASLSVISKQQSPELVYKSASVLLVNYPKKTVDLWIRLIDDLNPQKLIPALLTYNKTVITSRKILVDQNQAIRFLKYLIYEKQSKDKLIYNTYFSFLIAFANTDDENVTLKHLEQFGESRKRYFGLSGNGDVAFDYDFVLRLCFKFNKIHSAIYLYSFMGKNEDAVTLALNNDLIETAIQVAEQPHGLDDTTRKILWMKISKELVDKVLSNREYVSQHSNIFIKDKTNTEIGASTNEIYILLKFLTEACELITIRDLLPLFPDFIVIDNFKESLVAALQQLSADMNKLSTEMEAELTEAENVTLKIKNFKSRNFQIIDPYESCELCHRILTIRKFIVFPCSHAFHQDCLVKRILESNDYKKKNAIYKLQKQISLSKRNNTLSKAVKKDIDILLSSSCCLCSDMKINEIEEPLVKPGDNKMAEWKI